MKRSIFLSLIIVLFIFSETIYASELVVKGNNCNVSSITIPEGGRVQLTIVYNDIACCANFGCMYYNHDSGPGPCNHRLKLWSEIETIEVDVSKWADNISDTYELDTGESGRIYGKYLDTYCRDNTPIPPWNETINSHTVFIVESLKKPIAQAGPDQIVFDEISLDGNQSSDPDGQIISYEWVLSHRENSSYSRTANGVSPTISNLESGFYDVALTVTDNEGLSGTDTMLLAAVGYEQESCDELKTLLVQKDQTIADLNLLIIEKDQIIAEKDAIIADKDQTIADLNSTIADLNAVIADKDQIITNLNAIIASMYTQEELNQAIADACPGHSEYKGKSNPPDKKDKK